MPQSDHTPIWERRWQGLYLREIQALEACGHPFSVDHECLRQGKLLVEIQWPVAGVAYGLRIVYPDNYPRFKPDVFIIDPAQRPSRHCNTSNGSVCLLGRDSSQWNHTWTAVDLLNEQFQKVIEGKGEEDPQGEPDEVFWNGRSTGASYCLVDSSWALEDHAYGLATVQFKFSRVAGEPCLQMAVTELRNAAGAQIAKFSGVVPAALNQRGIIPWLQTKAPLHPSGDPEPELQRILTLPPVSAGRWLDVGNDRGIRAIAIAFASELSLGEQGVGWVVPFALGKPPLTPGPRRRELLFAQVLRAGSVDLLSRSPRSRFLAGKTISVFGAGSIGAPAIIELARAGCGKLNLFDQDVVEPGNSVRWPLGTSAWGKSKVQALKDSLASDYPLVEVQAFRFQVGNAELSHDWIEAELEASDLVCDFTASQGAAFWLGDVCREKRKALVSAFATQTLEGGVVAATAPDGACPACLVRAWDVGALQPPAGPIDADAGLFQPTGCAERTFTGSGYDLMEVSLQAVRVAVGRLQQPARPSEVFTLCLAEAGVDVLPEWKLDAIPRIATCDCNRTRR